MSSVLNSGQSGVSLHGPEGRNVISDMTEREVQAFFEKVTGWNLVFKNIDTRIPHNLSFPMEEIEDKDRGIDSLFSAYNPFTDRKEGIIVETKHVKEKRTLYTGRLKKYVKTLKEKLDGIRASGEFQCDPDVRAHIDGAVNYGLLILRFKRFDGEHFYHLCSQVDTSLHRGSNVPVIALLSNDKISAFIELWRKSTDGTLEFFYPRYLANSEPQYTRCLSLNYMLSDWILGVTHSGQRRRKFILSFDKPTSEFFELLNEILLKFRDEELFPGVDDIFFVNADYESKSLYEQRFENSPAAKRMHSKISILRQDLNMSYDIAEELR